MKATKADKRVEHLEPELEKMEENIREKKTVLARFSTLQQNLTMISNSQLLK